MGVTMTISREEIAVRLACADVQGSSLPPDKDRAVWAAQVVATTDAIGAALTHTPTPVAPPAGKYVPAVGDVIRWKWESAAEAEATYVRVVVGRDRWVGVSNGAIADDRRDEPIGEGACYLRHATPAERAAAGLAVPPPATAGVCPTCGATDPLVVLYPDRRDRKTESGLIRCRDPFHSTAPATPAPEAKRPEWVRVVRSESPHYIKDGQVYRVRGWEGGNPCVEHAAFPDAGFCLCATTWEPAPCPPPVAGSAEDVAVRDAEARVIAAAIAWNAKYNSDEVKYPEGAHSARLDLNDAVSALAEARAALSRPVRP